MPIRTVVWGENIHERTNAVVGKLYPKGMHEAIADLAASGRRDRRVDRHHGAAGTRTAAVPA